METRTEHKIAPIPETFALNLAWEVTLPELFIKESFKEITFGKRRSWVIEKKFLMLKKTYHHIWSEITDPFGA